MTQKSKNHEKRSPKYLLGEKPQSTSTSEAKEKELKHVCVLLIFRYEKIMLEPNDSKIFGKVIKPLSLKFDDSKNDAEAISMLVEKYKLSGLYDQQKKIEPVGNLKTDGKTFHIFCVRANKGNINAKGTFGFVNIDEVMEKDYIQIKGTGDCTITMVLKSALEATLAIV